MGGRRTKRRLWRWRSNPLRRRDDIVEAWLVLAVWAVVAVGGTLTGLMTANAADEVFADQRADRHAVRAVLLTDVPWTASAIGGTSDQARAKVRWTTADGSSHTGTTLVDTGQQAGARATVWTDGRGRLTTEPPSPTEAAVDSGLLGVGASVALAGTVIGAGAVARWRLTRRRIDLWGREWDLVGPQWGHKTG